MEQAIFKIKGFLEAFPYIQDFRSSLILIKLGGSLMESEEALISVLNDIAFMNCIGMKPVIVHGGGKAINKRLEELSIPIKKTAGLRHSDLQVIKVVDDVLHNQVNKDLVKKLQANDQQAQGISGKDILLAKKILASHPDTGAKVDLGFVGDVINVDTKQILSLLEQDVIPVITPFGKDNDGHVYNINADIAAARIAEKLKVRKLIFLSDVPGLLMDKNDESTLISSVSLAKVASYVDNGIIAGGMQPKVLSAVDALKAGVRKVHFIDGRMEHALLLELFTNEGIGTEIVH